MPERKRILFLHDDRPTDPLSSFMQEDLDTLRTIFDVTVRSVQPFRHVLEPVLSPTIWREVLGSHAVFGWFGTCAPVAMMARFVRKPVVIIAGGADVVWVPEIRYGLNPANRVQLRLFCRAYRHASRVLLFSAHSHEAFLALPGVRPQNAATLYLGVDAERFRPLGEKKPRVLTISYVSESALKRKGLVTFVEAARRSPEIEHRLAGLAVDTGAVKKLLESAPPNVKFLGFLTPEQLLQEYQEARVYAQLSMHEGFGVAVAEAMACECHCVTTDRGSLPEVVGDAGTIVPPEDPTAAAAAFQRILSGDDAELRASARRRVVELFSPERRRREVLRVMAEVMS